MNLDLSRAFFDSEGNLWIQCQATHPKADMFGPSGIARKPHPAEVRRAGWPGTHISRWAVIDDGAQDGPWGDGWTRPLGTQVKRTE